MTEIKSPGASAAPGASVSDQLGRQVIADNNRQEQFAQAPIRGKPPANAALPLYTRLDLFETPTLADPLSGLAVKLPGTCSKCGGLIAIVGPGKPPHSA